jgi:hypothetical protein
MTSVINPPWHTDSAALIRLRLRRLCVGQTLLAGRFVVFRAPDTRAGRCLVLYDATAKRRIRALTYAAAVDQAIQIITGDQQS